MKSLKEKDVFSVRLTPKRLQLLTDSFPENTSFTEVFDATLRIIRDYRYLVDAEIEFQGISEKGRKAALPGYLKRLQSESEQIKKSFENICKEFEKIKNQIDTFDGRIEEVNDRLRKI